MSTTLRKVWLSAMARLGRRSFMATSGLGHRYVCHLGDQLGEIPFYDLDIFRVELEVCAAWLRQEEKPVIFDVGANVGFWSTQLAQMIATNAPRIFAFEPVSPTFSKLVESVERLGLGDAVYPVPAAAMEVARSLRLSYSPRDSLFAQVADHGLNQRAGTRLVIAAGLTLDEFAGSLGLAPTFIKVDVEGSEVNVLRGARELLVREDRPAVLFEFNPVTLRETQMDPARLQASLGGYTLHYVDDFCGQRRPIGDRLGRLDEVDWVCNVLAVPATGAAEVRAAEAIAAARARCPARSRQPSLRGRMARSLRGGK